MGLTGVVQGDVVVGFEIEINVPEKDLEPDE